MHDFSYLIVYIYFISYINCSFDDDESNIFYMVPITMSSPFANFITIEMAIDGTIYQTPIDINSEENWVRTSFQSPPLTDSFKSPLIPKKCSSKGDSAPLSGKPSRLYGMTDIIINHITTQDDCEYQSSLSLGIQYNNKAHAIIESMRDYVKKVFGLYFDSRNHHEGKLMIGNLINEVIESRKKAIFCDTFIVYNKWNCYSQGIYIGEIKPEHKSMDGSINFIDNGDNSFYRLSTPVFIESMHRFIIVPIAFFHYLRSHYFKYHIEQTYQCSYGIEDIYTVMICNKSVIDQFPQIQFIFNKNIMAFSFEELFEEMNDGSSSMRFKIIAQKDSHDWSLGLIVLQKFNLVFDYPYHKVYLINQAENVDFIRVIDQALPDDKLKYWKAMVILFSLMFIFAFIGIFILLITLYIKKQILETLPAIK